MKKLLLSVAAAVLTVVGMSNIATLSPAYAADATGNANAYFDKITDKNDDNLMETIKLIINVIIGLVGMVAVVMMIMGGISFVTSQGDTAKVTKARNTILYGVVGLIVALLAFAIVNFVLSEVFNLSAGSIWLSL